MWTIRTEFSSQLREKKECDANIKVFFQKMFNIVLFRNTRYFEKYLAKGDFESFVSDMETYKKNYGFDILDTSLTISEFGLSEKVLETVLSVRNQFGIRLLTLILLPIEVIHDDFLIQISKLLKQIVKKFDLVELLQEVAFDMGCSSYALGKFYDYCYKTFSLVTEKEVSGDLENEMTNDELDIICTKIDELTKHIVKMNNLLGRPLNKNQINYIDMCSSRYVPYGKKMPNNELIYCIEKNLMKRKISF
jgi:hypothetical protein